MKKIDFSIDISPKKDFGVLSSNIAMIGSKTLKCSPTELAEKIIFFFKDEKQMEKIEIIKPGFINFFFKNSFWQDQLKEFLKIKKNLIMILKVKRFVWNMFLQIQQD